MPESQGPASAAHDLDRRLARYSRQILYEGVGVEGQRRLQESRALLIGCGALGTVLADLLVRAGVGFLRICDRDYIEADNLQRQVLFDEQDIAANLPKAEAAAAKLRRINSQVTVDPHVVDVNYGNIESLAEGAHVLLDGTDNFETRYLINDLAIKTNRPWVYGAVIGTSGLCMTVVPGVTPCLRCVFEEPPPPEANPTCDTVGVLASAVHVVAALQALEAMKLLMRRADAVNRHLVSVDVWSGRMTNLNVQSSRRRGDCPCCTQGNFEYLAGRRGSTAITLCGRDAVQIHTKSTSQAPADFAAVAARLSAVASAPVQYNRFMLRAAIDGYELTLFPDGRSIIKGTDDPEKARAVHAKYLGA